jgi:hypothetical protein
VVAAQQAVQVVQVHQVKDLLAVLHLQLLAVAVAVQVP